MSSFDVTLFLLNQSMTTIQVKSCANNIFDNLVALGGSGKMQGGFIMPSQKQVDELTACPWLRFSLTYGWPGRKGWTCFHPGHLGKRTKTKIVLSPPPPYHRSV